MKTGATGEEAEKQTRECYARFVEDVRKAAYFGMGNDHAGYGKNQDEIIGEVERLKEYRHEHNDDWKEMAMLRERAASAVYHEEQVRAELNATRAQLAEMKVTLAAVQLDNRWLEATLRKAGVMVGR